MCPLAFSSYLQAPVPFIIGEGVGGGERREGVRKVWRGERGGKERRERGQRGRPYAKVKVEYTHTHTHTHTGIDSQYFDVFEKPVEVCVVDLDANLITL